MGRPSTPANETHQRRRAWAYARRQCSLPTNEIARMVERSPETVKSYGKAAGSVPTWDAIRVLQVYNLDAAFRTIADRYGAEAVVRIRGDAR